jgi:hypothetical protein
MGVERPGQCGVAVVCGLQGFGVTVAAIVDA